MENQRLLYLVQHSNKEMFKIGIGTDNGRFRDLDRDYLIDWDSSIYFKGENQDVIKMERILHRLFYEYRLDKQNGTGGTEWFSSKCLESTVEAVLFNVDNSGFSIDLHPKEIILQTPISENDVPLENEHEEHNWNQHKQKIFNKYPQPIIDKWIKLDNLEPTLEIVDEMNRLIPEFYCALKPSEQISCIYERDNKIVSLEPFQFDAMNFFCYQSRKQILMRHSKKEIKQSISGEEELFDFLRNQKIEINLNELAAYTNKYKEITNRKNMTNAIKKLEDTKVKIGIFKSSKVLVEDRFSLISRTRRITNSNIITIWLEPELILGWVFGTKPFAKMFLSIQAALNLTYTKILYELCKDYINLGSIKKEFGLWKKVLNLKADNVSRIKYNYLNKAMKEINEKTDIKITKIYGEKKNGTTSMIVEFEKQSEKRLQELGLIEEPLTSLPYYNKSKAKLDKLVKNGYKVVDEDMWIQTDLNKNEKQYESEVRVDNWFKETEQNDRNKVYEVLAESLDDCDDPMVIIEDYKIVGLFSKYAFTRNPSETIEKLNLIIDEMNDVDVTD